MRVILTRALAKIKNRVLMGAWERWMDMMDEANELRDKLQKAARKMLNNQISGRGLHSSTSQLNLGRFWSLKPQQASMFAAQPETFFADATSEHSPQRVLTSSGKVDVCSPQTVLTLS